MGRAPPYRVAAIATVAVGAKAWAKRFADTRAGYGMLAMRGIEVCASLVIIAFGVLLLAGYSERAFGRDVKPDNRSSIAAGDQAAVALFLTCLWSLLRPKLCRQRPRRRHQRAHQMATEQSLHPLLHRRRRACGLMLGFLLARAGVDVVVLEARRLPARLPGRHHHLDPRADEQLGMYDEFLRPYTQGDHRRAWFGNRQYAFADFTLPTRAKFIALMQWDFLNFLAEKGKAYPRSICARTEAASCGGGRPCRGVRQRSRWSDRDHGALPSAATGGIRLCAARRLRGREPRRADGRGLLAC
jgi:hypothetical protein